jgi:DNA or RNA helicases of superfamily II
MFQTGEWVWNQEHGELCRIIEAQTLWGETTCRVWLLGKDTVVRLPAARLRPISEVGTGTADEVAYVAAATRVADALTQDVLLAPIESSVIPLPHQIRALSRAIANDRVRYLLADEVGLGKTIEAGFIMRELKLRGLVKRTLVIAPKGLVTQWVSEMRFHFGETFQLVLPEDIKTLKRIAPATGPGNDEKGNHNPEILPANAWQMFSQVVVPMDSVKPLDKRRGWTATQVGDYNRERFEDLISAGWDLVIVDEAHRLGGSTDQVARFKLGQGLSEAAPYLLLLSATRIRARPTPSIGWSP